MGIPFITEEDGGKNFQVKLANTTDADVKININPNLEVEGYNALKDGEVVTGLTAVKIYSPTGRLIFNLVQPDALVVLV